MALPALRLQGLYLALATMAFAQMAAILFFPQPEILGFDGKPIRSLRILGFDFSQPFTFLGIHFDQDVGTMLFIAAALGVVGVLVVWLHRSAFGRRLTALGDSPAACATLGVNPIVTKLGVFVISAAIAGFAGALLGVFQGTATVQDFEMLNGLAYLLLLVVGGVAVVSGAVLGGTFLTLFSWLPTILPGWAWLTELGKWQQRLGPGLAGIGIGRQPSGIIPTVGEDLRAQNARKRAEREALEAGSAPRDGSSPPPASTATTVPEASVPSPGA
jgi:branched-chain amino acid transport system permease protein